MSTKPPTYVLDHPEIRDSVTRLCEGFPGEYWRKCDREQDYPREFVEALTQAGFLSALIPEEFDGSGLPLSAGAAISSSLKPVSPVSIDRSAFCTLSEKVRPIAMASPTDFIAVVNVSSAPGNFSNVKRGIFVTT